MGEFQRLLGILNEHRGEHTTQLYVIEAYDDMLVINCEHCGKEIFRWRGDKMTEMVVLIGEDWEFDPPVVVTKECLDRAYAMFLRKNTDLSQDEADCIKYAMSVAIRDVQERMGGKDV